MATHTVTRAPTEIPGISAEKAYTLVNETGAVLRVKSASAAPTDLNDGIPIRPREDATIEAAASEKMYVWAVAGQLGAGMIVYVEAV